MNKIINKEHFSEKVFKLEIEAPLIAKSRKAGHFVIVRVGEKGERLRLFLSDVGYAKAQASERRGEIKIRKHAAVIEGHILPDRKKRRH